MSTAEANRVHDEYERAFEAYQAARIQLEARAVTLVEEFAEWLKKGHDVEFTVYHNDPSGSGDMDIQVKVENQKQWLEMFNDEQGPREAAEELLGEWWEANDETLIDDYDLVRSRIASYEFSPEMRAQ